MNEGIYGYVPRLVGSEKCCFAMFSILQHEHVMYSIPSNRQQNFFCKESRIAEQQPKKMCALPSLLMSGNSALLNGFRCEVMDGVRGRDATNNTAATPIMNP